MNKKPRNWRAIEISELCDQIIDCVNKTAPVVERPTPYKMIRTTNVRNGMVDTSNVKYVSENVYKTWTRRGLPKKGDVILTREAPLGEIGLLRSNEKVFLGQRLVMYRANPKLLNNRFLLYALLGDDLQGQIKSYGSGSTVEHMRVPDCGKLVLKTPELENQNKIASVLSAYDDLIENNAKRIKILEEMAQAIYREWFVNFRFPGYENVKMVDSPLGPIPEGWEIKQLGEIIELAYGKALKGDARVAGSVPVYGSAGIVGWHNKSIVEGPGIIVGRKGNVGKVYWSDVGFFPIDTVFFVRTSIQLTYAYFNLQYQHFISTDTAVPGLSRHQAYLLPFLLPPRDLLKTFDKHISPLLTMLKVIRAKSTNLRQTRDLILPKLISGELDVSDLDIVMEAVET